MARSMIGLLVLHCPPAHKCSVGNLLCATVLVKVGVSCRQAVLPALLVWGTYHVVHYSVVQLVNSTWYAKERGEEQARHRVKKFVLCAPAMRHAGFPAFDRYYITTGLVPTLLSCKKSMATSAAGLLTLLEQASVLRDVKK